MKYGLIGEHLRHSFSKEVHAMLSDYEYEIHEVARDALEKLLTNPEFTAINVTIPYKEQVIPYLSSISDEAKKIGAVNTVVNKNGKLYGYNTDFFGMLSLIKRMGLVLRGKKVAILGTGGTSRTAAAVSAHLGAARIIRVSRNPSSDSVSYNELYTEHYDAEIIINTTPVGMYPSGYASPITLDVFKNLEGVVETIYNPIRTKLVLDAKAKGAIAEGGLYMLVAQAAMASELFTGVRIPEERIDEIYFKVLKEKESIVLTGMPASGKSTIGALLSNALSRTLLDTDDMIVSSVGAPITKIFENEGEKQFRDYETREIANASLQNGVIIATGGGAVLREENVNMLKQNGRIYFLDRAPQALIPTADRPLASSSEDILKRHAERYEIYLSTCDRAVDANGEARDVMNEIIGDFYR